MPPNKSLEELKEEAVRVAIENPYVYSDGDKTGRIQALMNQTYELGRDQGFMDCKEATAKFAAERYRDGLKQAQMIIEKNLHKMSGLLQKEYSKYVIDKIESLRTYKDNKKATTKSEDQREIELEQKFGLTRALPSAFKDNSNEK